MKSRQRRSFSAEMKSRIALEAIKGQKTIQEIASHYGVHPNQVTKWKKQAVEAMPRRGRGYQSGILSHCKKNSRRRSSAQKQVFQSASGSRRTPRLHNEYRLEKLAACP